MLPRTLLHKWDSGTQIQMLIIPESLPAHSKRSHTSPLQGLLPNTEGLDFFLIQSINRDNQNQIYQYLGNRDKENCKALLPLSHLFLTLSK